MQKQNDEKLSRGLGTSLQQQARSCRARYLSGLGLRTAQEVVGDTGNAWDQGTTSGRLLPSTISPSSGSSSHTALHPSHLTLTWEVFKGINSAYKKDKSNHLKINDCI